MIVSNETGKDNLVAILMSWLQKLQNEGLNATSTLRSGKITTTGILNHLKKHGNQVQIINGELEKVLNKSYRDKMQEGDVIELLDGSEAFGKCTGMDNACVRPVAWMFLATQKKVYAQQMGGESCGRLRFVVWYLDTDQVRAVPFEERLVPRNKSQEILVETLREVMLAQQRRPEGEAQPWARCYPRGLESPEMRGLWDEFLVSRFAPLARHLHTVAHPVEVPSQLPAADEGMPATAPVPGTGSTASGPAPKRRKVVLRGQNSKRQETPNASPATKHDDVPKQLPELSVREMQFSPAGTMIVAGVMDGTNAACNQSPNPESASVVTKHAGKALGACAAANTALRNGLARWAIGRDVPMDPRIRLFDCLGALPKIEIYSVNQMGLEHEILAQKAGKKDGKDVAEKTSQNTIQPVPAACVSPIDIAVKRFCEGMHFNASKTAPHSNVWELAANAGIPFAVPSDNFWYNFRQHWFTKSRVKEASFSISIRSTGSINSKYSR